MDKTYKTIDELINCLKEEKKIIVKDEHRCVFEERSYSSLINPYKEFFSYGKNDEGKYIYKNEVDFEEILKIIQIDEAFSATMYSYIGVFEKKFKTVLFNEICKKYIECDNPDLTCTKYVEEITTFLETEDFENLPRFCTNFPYLLTKKGYVKDEYDIDKKNDLLNKIKEIGTGINRDGKVIEKNNILIEHYLQAQLIAPLWVIPGALTLGELKILFSILDSHSQKRIISKLYTKEEYSRLSLESVLKFLGILEMIRRIRNIVNHYEPIFPFMLKELKPIRYIENSQVYSVLNLLEDTYFESINSKTELSELNYEKNNFNSKHTKILNMMMEFSK